MTVRTLTEIATLFPDNTVGTIDEPALRDFLESLRVAGAIAIKGNSIPQITAAGVAVITNWSEDTLNLATTPQSVSDRIRIDNAGLYDVFFACSFEGANGAEYRFELQADGTPTGFVSKRTINSNGEIGQASVRAPISFLALDNLEALISSPTANSITIKEAILYCKRFS